MIVFIRQYLRKQRYQNLDTKHCSTPQLGRTAQIVLYISCDNDWKVFETNFEQAHEQFLKKVKAKYPELSSKDLRLCAYLRMNLSSKEIAPLLGISVRGVENHRYRLRKKMNLKHDEKLTETILHT